MMRRISRLSQPARRKSQHGLTLIEVLVSMTIGLLLLLALGTLMINASRHFKISDEFARMQENGAFALNVIGNDLRMAGFYGYISSADITQPVHITVTNDCGADWAVNIAQPLFGYSGQTGTTAAATLTCIHANNFIDGSPILVVRGASGMAVQPVDLVTGTLYVQSDPNGGIIFDGHAYAAFTTPPKRTVLGGAGAPVYPYQAKAYYLRPCSRTSAADGVCLSSDDESRPIPTLVRQELSGSTMVEVPVAEGIEAMSILYGVDSDSNGVPENYISSPTTAQFSQVVSARVSLLVRSPKPTPNYNDGNKSYDLDGDGIAEFTCTAGVNCGYHRHVFSQSFQLRNMAQRIESR